MSEQEVDWKAHGVKVIPKDSLDTNTAQTPGMNRAAAINYARVGAQKIWAGTVNICANAKTGAHHHGALESVIYVVRGRARMRWGDRLEYVAEAGPGDFIYVPPYVPHQEINASTDETLECVLVRSDNEAVVVNLDIEPVEEPSPVRWVDPITAHKLNRARKQAAKRSEYDSNHSKWIDETIRRRSRDARLVVSARSSGTDRREVRLRHGPVRRLYRAREGQGRAKLRHQHERRRGQAHHHH